MILSLYFKTTHKKYNDKKLIKFNSSLNKIEIYMGGNKDQALCMEASYAEKLIISNLDLYKELEPNYDWIVMQNLLQSIPINFCKVNN